jgi:phage baseplate assembly protein W
MDDIPHIGTPIRIVGTSYATVQQDTTDEVAACVNVIASYPLGSRDEAPDFGVIPLEFTAQPLDLSDLTQACEVYEPRAVLTVTQSDPADAPGEATVQIVVGMATAED